jgi:glutamate-1-semialdehyde 2,1-aminomutase
MYNTAVISPKPGYLEGLREVTRKHGIVLIFDEVITGFRMAPGGAQERYGITPDMTVLAKAIANGYPLAAVVGRTDIMEVSDPRKHRYIYGGTYNSNYMCLAAASACLSKLENGEIQKNLQRTGKLLQQKVLKVAKDLGINDLQFHEESGKFQFLFASHEVKDYWSACAVDIERYQMFQKVLWENGIYSRPAPFFHHSLTASHAENTIEKIVKIITKGLEKIKN